MSCSFIIGKSVSEAFRDCNHFINSTIIVFSFCIHTFTEQRKMNHNTSLGEKKADMADTDLSNIDVVLNPRSKEHCEIPPEFPDPLNLPSLGSRSLENKKFQGKETYNKNCQMTSGIHCEGSSLQC